MEHILDQAEEPEKEEAIRLLGLVICARRPLKWHEIQGAISIDLNDKTVDFENRHLRVTSKDLCGSLVEVNTDESITIVHATARR
jgi:hypothetical protein